METTQRPSRRIVDIGGFDISPPQLAAQVEVQNGDSVLRSISFANRQARQYPPVDVDRHLVRFEGRQHAIDRLIRILR